MLFSKRIKEEQHEGRVDDRGDAKRPKKRIIKKKGKKEKPKAVIKERGLKAAQQISSP